MTFWQRGLFCTAMIVALHAVDYALFGEVVDPWRRFFLVTGGMFIADIYNTLPRAKDEQ